MVAAARALAIVLAVCAVAPAQRVRVNLARGGVTTVEMEEYVQWVLAGEAGGLTQNEALKAMAIAARSYARANLGRHAREGIDFCETTHCQDARPAGVTARLRSAQEATEGVVLWYRGRLATGFYHQNCGGRTAAAGEVWPGEDKPFLQSVEDARCLVARGNWTRSLSLDEFAKGLGLAKVERVEVGRRTVSGRVAEILTDRGPVAASRIGWEVTPSRLYEAQVENGRVVFRGRGEGHGAGLCQIGAEARAKAGAGATAILAAYYPGVRAGQTPQDIPWKVMSGERVEVWATDSSLVGVADAALAEAEKRTGLRVNARVRVRVYPSIAMFRDATGEPGFVAASTRGRTIRVQPAGRLRSEGLLEPTLLHEMIHVALEGSAGPAAPAWLMEGLAAYFEKGSGRAEALNAETERRLVRPSNEAELRQAYGNAWGAVTRLVREKGIEAVMKRLSAGGAGLAR